MLFPLESLDELTDEGLRELAYQVQREIERREDEEREDEEVG